MTPTSDDVAQWIGQLCADLAFVQDRAEAAGPDAAARLAALADTARAGRADRGWTVDLVDLLRRLGIPVAHAERVWPFADHPLAGLVALGDGPPSTDRYRCPLGRCGRVELRQPGGAVPRCRLAGADLTVVGEPR